MFLLAVALTASLAGSPQGPSADLITYASAADLFAAGDSVQAHAAVGDWTSQRFGAALTELARQHGAVKTLERAAHFEAWLARDAERRADTSAAHFHRDRGARLLASLKDTGSAEFKEAWYLAVALDLLQDGELGQARAFAEAGINGLPSPARLWVATGMVNEAAAGLDSSTAKLGGGRQAPGRTIRLALAEAAYRRALTLAPDLGVAQLRLGRVLSLGGQHEPAVDLLETATRSADTRTAYLAYLFLGREAVSRDDLQTASRAYESARAQCPGCQTALMGLSELAHRSGQYDTARKLVSDIAGLGSTRSDDPWWGYLLGNAERTAVHAWLAEAVR